jgi:hypothetical protein
MQKRRAYFFCTIFFLPVTLSGDLNEVEGLSLSMRVVSVSVAAAALWFVMEGIIFTLPVTNMSLLE